VYLGVFTFVMTDSRTQTFGLGQGHGSPPAVYRLRQSKAWYMGIGLPWGLDG
jgi:hypothetical protein